MNSPVYHAEYKSSNHNAVHPDIEKERGKDKKDRANAILQTEMSNLTAVVGTNMMGLGPKEMFSEKMYLDLIEKGNNIAFFGLTTYDKSHVADYLTAVGAILEKWDRIPQEVRDGDEHREILVACWLKAKNCGYMLDPTETPTPRGQR